jgi:hypothetical protein
MSTFSGKMSTFSGKCQPFQENDCQPFQENVNDFRKITIQQKTRVKEGRLNLYQGLEAIHSTLFRGCPHTRSGVKVSKCQSVKIDFEVKNAQSK